MKNTFGNSICVTLFGESHGPFVGAVIDGLPSGIPVNQEYIRYQLSRRRPVDGISTTRKEVDDFSIVSGVYNGKTTGTPLCIMIENNDVKSEDYEQFSYIARPGHADYTAFCKYRENADFRGGGHFSGRITTAAVAVGAIVIDALKEKGIFIGTHIKQCGSVCDRTFHNIADDISVLSVADFPMLDSESIEEAKAEIINVGEVHDSIGGILETAVIGVPVGVGEPWFDNCESVISHLLFSIPGVKGVAFGEGFHCADLKGSEMNDAFIMDNGFVKTKTNHNGGVNGGITNGMPIVFSTAVKPASSIGITQKTVDFVNKKEVEINVGGRHDPCFIHRAAVVQDSFAALAVADLLAQKFGTDWLVK